MIKFFKANDRDFKTNGLFSVKPLKAIETKKKSLNGWELEVELPISYKDDIEQDMIALASVKSKQNPQAFRIKNIKKTSRKLSFIAEHVMFDARDYFLLDVRPTDMGAPATLKYINERTDTPSPFFVNSNVSNSATAYFIRKSLLEAWEVIEERWGGTFDADNWNISLRTRVGNDNGEIITYGKNLEDIKVFEDWSDVVTRLYPVGNDGLMLPEKFIESDFFYPTPYTKTVTMHSDEEETEDIPEEVLIKELREKAKEYLKVNKYPKVSYEVKSDVNQELEIGDTVMVKHPIVTLETEVLEYTYNLNTKRTESLVFGNYKRDVKKVFESYKKDINDTKNQLTNVEQIIGHQTDLINSLNKEGYVVRNENETLILDKKPKEDAKYVWRFGMGGIGFSTNGYEGPFTMAWTQDGMLNTDFISAGTIMTNHLHSDVGSSLDLSSNKSIKLLAKQLNSRNIWVNSSGIAGVSRYTFDSEPMKMTKDMYYMGPFSGYVMGSGIPIIRTINTETIAKRGLEFFMSGTLYNDKTQVRSKETHFLRMKTKGFGSQTKFYINEYTDKNSETPFNVIELPQFMDSDSFMIYEHEISFFEDTVYMEIVIEYIREGQKLFVISDGMLTEGGYQDYEPTAEEIILFTQSSIELVEDEIKLVAENTDALGNRVNAAEQTLDAVQGITSKHTNEIETASQQISYLDGITSTHSNAMNSSKVKLTADRGLQTWGNGITAYDQQGRSALYLDSNTGNLTISGDIHAGNGNVGNFDIKNGTLTTETKKETKKFVEADVERIKQIIMGDVIPNQKDFKELDVNGDGDITAADYMIVKRAVVNVYPNPITYTEKVELGAGKTGILSFRSLDVPGLPQVKQTKVMPARVESERVVANSVNAARLYTTKGMIINYVQDLEMANHYNPGLSYKQDHNGFWFKGGNLRAVHGDEYLGTSGNRFAGAYLKSNPNVSSDIRHKDIKGKVTDAREFMKLVDVYEYKNMDNPRTIDNGLNNIGFIAQEIERANYILGKEKASYLTKEESYLSLDYTQISLYNWQVTKELIEENENMQKRLDKQQKEIDELKQIVKELI